MTVDEAKALSEMPRAAVLVVITNGEVRIGEVSRQAILKATLGVGEYVARRYRSREAETFDAWLAAVDYVANGRPGKG
jgi:hypothetical protein